MNKDAYKFIDWVINQAFDGCDVDGFDIQEQAEACGLLKQQEMKEPCCESCACAEVTDFPTTCYRKTYLETMREEQ